MSQSAPARRTAFPAVFGAVLVLSGLLPVFPAAVALGAGSVSLTTSGVAYAETFDSLAVSGTSSDTPLGWAFSEAGTNANTLYTAGTGSANAGDTYSFGTGTATERSFGGLLSGSLNPTIGVSLTNATGGTITSFDLTYTGEQWRLGALGRVDSLQVQLSTDATNLTNGTWTGLTALDFIAPIQAGTAGALDGNAAANRSVVSGSVMSLAIPDGSTFWLRWIDFNATGADDGLGIDDLSLTPFVTDDPTDPTAVGAATPSSVAAGASTLLTVAVSPGANPTSTGITVTGDLSAIGGSATQAFTDDGSGGDATAGDGTFSYTATVAAGTPEGAASLPVTIADAEARSSSTSIALTVVGAGATLVINEIDYDQPAGDTAEFLEIRNVGSGAIDLDDISVQLVNGNGGAIYLTIDLPAVSLAAGDYYVICANAATTPGCDLDVSPNTDLIQNGAPDAVALRDGTVLIDAVSYEGNTVAPYTEGSGVGLIDTAATGVVEGISRCPDGTDTDVNNVDLVLRPITTGSQNFCPGNDPAPFVSSTFPAAGAVGVARAAGITITFSEPVDVSGSWFTISCITSGIHTASVSGGPTTFTLDPDADFASAESCTVTVVAANVADQDTTEPLDRMSTDHRFSFTTIDQTLCGDPGLTAISAIQGSGLQSPMTGSIVSIEAIVVGDYQQVGGFEGFHVQEQDADADADPATSEGLFVFSTAADVAIGDHVRVRGTVTEFFSTGQPLTELAQVTQVIPCSTGNVLPTPTVITLPVATLDGWERAEGMRVSIAQTLTVTETFTLGRFGEVSLSVGGRLPNPTNVAEPGPDANAQASLNDRSRIVLDDGDNRQNIDPTRYPQGGLSASNTLRSGDTLPGLDGVLEQRFGVYRVQPTGPVAFSHENARPAAPTAVGGNLRVAAFNVLNYFNGDGAGGGFPTPRGATTPAELERQSDKIVAAITQLDADIVGLMELENDAPGLSAIEELVARLNAVAGAGTYDFIDTGVVGTDEIRVGLLYQPAVVSPVGAHAILTSTVDPRFIDTKNRPTLAQTFELNASGERLTVAVNHLKSKGSDCLDVGDPDTGDEQGNCNVTRTQAAAALVDWLAADPTGSGDPDRLIIGDLNAYAREDPIDEILAAGYTDEIAEDLGRDAYSFVFSGESGYLDHALSSASLTGQVAGVTEWHVNADEPIVLDYNTEFKTAGQIASFYAPTAYRSSDHDPVLVGIELGRCRFSDDEDTKTRTLLSDCSTTETIHVPDGWTLDGDGHSISAYDPPGGHFLGAVVANAGAVAHVRDLGVTAYRLADACDEAVAARLRGILLDTATGSITDSHVYGVRQGDSGCLEGNSIEVRNAPFTAGGTDLRVVITGNVIEDYMKTGILLDGSVAGDVQGNTIDGRGPISSIAQNGIQVSRGASAGIIGNTVTDNFYVPKSFQACGLLFFEAEGVRQQSNTFSGNEKDVCNAGRGGGSISG